MSTAPLKSADPAFVDDVFSQLEGQCTFHESGIALNVHVNDTVERSTCQTRFQVTPKLTIALILEGDLDASLGGLPLVMTARNGPMGYCWINEQDSYIDRYLRAGQRIRKLTISTPLADCESLFNLTDIRQGLDSKPGQSLPALRHWTPNAQVLRYAEEVIQGVHKTSSLQRIDSHIAALTITRHTLAELATPLQPLVSTPNTREAARARSIRDFIIEHVSDTLSIQTIAEHASMSVSTLQRIFKSSYGCTVMEFIRIRRLELARLALLNDGITVGEAAFAAGYSSTANFSTAFQREFGYPPSSCIRR